MPLHKLIASVSWRRWHTTHSPFIFSTELPPINGNEPNGLWLCVCLVHFFFFSIFVSSERSWNIAQTGGYECTRAREPERWLFHRNSFNQFVPGERVKKMRSRKFFINGFHLWFGEGLSGDDLKSFTKVDRLLRARACCFAVGLLMPGSVYTHHIFPLIDLLNWLSKRFFTAFATFFLILRTQCWRSNLDHGPLREQKMLEHIFVCLNFNGYSFVKQHLIK